MVHPSDRDLVHRDCWSESQPFLPEELLGGPGGEEGDGEEGDFGDGIYGYVYIWCTTWCVSTHLKNMLVKLDHLPNRRPYDQGLWKPVWFPLIRPAMKNPYFWRGYPRGVGWPAIIFGGKTSFGGGIVIERSWNPKQPFINGCFNWMIPDLHIRKWLFHQTSIYKCLFGVPGFYMNITFTVVGALLRVSHQTNGNFDMSCCYFWEQEPRVHAESGECELAFSIGDTSSNGCFSIVRLVFGEVNVFFLFWMMENYFTSTCKKWWVH